MINSSEKGENFQSADQSAPDSKAPTYGVKEYFERAAGFYYKDDQPREEALFTTLLQEMNAHTNEGRNWKEDEYLVDKIEKFIKERFENLITQKKADGDEESVQYYEERQRILLEDLRRKE